MKRNRKHRDVSRYKAAFAIWTMDRSDDGEYLDKCRSRLLTDYGMTCEDLKQLEFDAVTSVAGKCYYARKAL